jgi:hypothetical protein
MIKSKKMIIMLIVSVAIIAAVIVLIIINAKKDILSPGVPIMEIAPDILADAEKEKLGVPLETEIQALKRGESGEVLIYKTIKSEEDLVGNPAAIKPISPNQGENVE